MFEEHIQHAQFKSVAGGSFWWMTVVYDPCSDRSKPAFLAELHDLRLIRSRHWLLCGDFNMVYHAEGKRNGCVNRCLIQKLYQHRDP
jgi:hypothetical protein